ncbi:MAG: M18 family aminopeptidase [Chlamydiota bacterium]
MTKEEEQRIISDLVSFLDRSPTAWHATELSEKMLQEQGFQKVHEKDSWDLRPGTAYYVVRNETSLCAFITPNKPPVSARVAAAHSDSPALKIKPQGEYQQENMKMLDVEVYGGPLLTSWLNRDLGIAGSVVVKESSGAVVRKTVTLDDAVVTIPQLAVHLDRQVNEKGLVLNRQDHLSAIASINDYNGSFIEGQLRKKVGSFKELLGFDLFLYPLEPAKYIGPNQEMLASYRYDNLGSAHACLTGLFGALTPSDETLKMVVIWDHEEVGSSTANGAASPFFRDTLDRIMLHLSGATEDVYRILSESFCLSVDQAHALHPNYPSRHDPRHAPLLGKGVTIKHNAQQRYATNAIGQAMVKELCQKNGIDFQEFVSRGDMPCGSTIGPIHATATGMKTVDVGCPQLSMHGARELSACSDHLSMSLLVQAFLN